MRRYIPAVIALLGANLSPPAASASSFCMNGYGGRAMYLAGGQYVYIYPSGRKEVGHWTGQVGKEVTVTFKNGFVRHDKFEKSGGVMYLVNKNGLAFPGMSC